MATPRGEHSRHISCWLTEDEWKTVLANMERGGFRTKSAYLRHVAVTPKIIVREVGVGEPEKVRADLARIGNNVNQIARLANARRAADGTDIANVIALLRECRDTLARAAGEA